MQLIESSSERMGALNQQPVSADLRHKKGPKLFVGLQQGGIGGRLDRKLDSSVMRSKLRLLPVSH